MIIWINGSFGSGKTSISIKLKERIQHAHIYDPEEVGFFIRDNIPKEINIDDFQNFQMWRDFNYTMLSNIEAKYDGITIVPMTVVDEKYFQEIIGRLRNDGLEIKHYTLLAKKETLLKRLQERGDHGNPWITARLDNCITSLNRKLFSTHIETDDKTLEEITDIILTDCGLINETSAVKVCRLKSV
jgi:cytidylate kinase